VLKVDLKVSTVTGLVDTITDLDVDGFFCDNAHSGREHSKDSSETHDE
jgi:hypothetical protein